MESDVGAGQAEFAVPESQVFRTRAVVISGFVDLVVGLLIACVGIVIFAGTDSSNRRGIAGAIGFLGLLLVLSGTGRIAAKLEVHPDKVVWWWSFSKHHHSLADLTEACLVEPGNPSSGGVWTAFIGGGLLAVGAWWLLAVAYSMYKAEPTLGTRTLVIVPRVGAAVRIRPIGTFATGLGSPQAFAAQQATEEAIRQSHHHTR